MNYNRRGRNWTHNAINRASSQAIAKSPAEFKSKVDKASFYKTMDIFNGLLEKKIKLEPGQSDMASHTDGKTIWVNFSEKHKSEIASTNGTSGDYKHYILKCGHEWKSTKDYSIGHEVPCWTCSSLQMYRSFEHEWQHVFFRSNVIAAALFSKKYAALLHQRYPNAGEDEIQGFVHKLLNALDDIRCNSLWEKPYPGSAYEIWKRWYSVVTQLNDHNTNFLSLIYAVLYGLPINTGGPFYQLIPVIQWAVDRVRYRGFRDVLLVARVVIDRCMDLLLRNIPPQPNPPPQPPPIVVIAAMPLTPGQASSDPSGQPQQLGSQPTQTPPPVPNTSPSSPPTDQGNALIDIINYAKPVQDNHPDPATIDPSKDPSSTATANQVLTALGLDTSNMQVVDAALGAGTIDVDMGAMINLLGNLPAPKSQDSKLMADAKAKVSFIDVEASGITEKVVLEAEELLAVSRMRTAFFRSLGRMKMKRAMSGLVVDTPSFVQFLGDRQDPDVFENMDVNRGFAYHVVTDMSGSMSSCFPQVEHGSEMLKRALDFPFVVGETWGFRGADSHGAYRADDGEVWLYRYDRDCDGYIGMGSLHKNGRNWSVPVRCGGLTPMHTAIRVALHHLRTDLPAGMVKRLFVLTDGSPIAHKVNGGSMSDVMLKAFVANEVRAAKSYGIEVYGLVIGSGVDDKDCNLMFGAKNWRRAERGSSTGTDTVYAQLTALVLDKFQRFLRSR